jgi:hypothetical protein
MEVVEKKFGDGVLSQNPSLKMAVKLLLKFSSRPVFAELHVKQDIIPAEGRRTVTKEDENIKEHVFLGDWRVEIDDMDWTTCAETSMQSGKISLNKMVHIMFHSY